MRRLYLLLLSMIFCCFNLFAQDNELQLARQFAANGEHQKALSIFQKLYKQDNDVYLNEYLNELLILKKYDEAESIVKKNIRKHPDNWTYTITLGRIYSQQGQTGKADALYNDL